jgi:ATP synthase protein I
MVRALSKSRESRFRAFGWEKGEHSNMPDPDELRALGKRLDEVRRQKEPRPTAPPSAAGVAVRLMTELVVAVAVGVGLGWMLDRWLHTRPIFLVVMLVLGAAAGILNLMRAAAEINARYQGGNAPVSNDKDEES